jgi:hypothetical protein
MFQKKSIFPKIVDWGGCRKRPGNSKSAALVSGVWIGRQGILKISRHASPSKISHTERKLPLIIGEPADAEAMSFVPISSSAVTQKTAWEDCLQLIHCHALLNDNIFGFSLGQEGERAKSRP